MNRQIVAKIGFHGIHLALLAVLASLSLNSFPSSFSRTTKLRFKEAVQSSNQLLDSLNNVLRENLHLTDELYFRNYLEPDGNESLSDYILYNRTKADKLKNRLSLNERLFTDFNQINSGEKLDSILLPSVYNWKSEILTSPLKSENEFYLNLFEFAARCHFLSINSVGIRCFPSNTIYVSADILNPSESDVVDVVLLPTSTTPFYYYPHEMRIEYPLVPDRHGEKLKLTFDKPGLHALPTYLKFTNPRTGELTERRDTFYVRVYP